MLCCFFDRNNPLGPRPRGPGLHHGGPARRQDRHGVLSVAQGQDQPCCPTGIGQVRFQIGADGTLEAQDPIPSADPLRRYLGSMVPE